MAMFVAEPVIWELWFYMYFDYVHGDITEEEFIAKAMLIEHHCAAINVINHVDRIKKRGEIEGFRALISSHGKGSKHERASGEDVQVPAVD